MSQSHINKKNYQHRDKTCFNMYKNISYGGHIENLAHALPLSQLENQYGRLNVFFSSLTRSIQMIKLGALSWLDSAQY